MIGHFDNRVVGCYDASTEGRLHRKWQQHQFLVCNLELSVPMFHETNIRSLHLLLLLASSYATNVTQLGLSCRHGD